MSQDITIARLRIADELLQKQLQLWSRKLHKFVKDAEKQLNNIGQIDSPKRLNTTVRKLGRLKRDADALPIIVTRELNKIIKDAGINTKVRFKDLQKELEKLTNEITATRTNFSQLKNIGSSDKIKNAFTLLADDIKSISQSLKNNLKNTSKSISDINKMMVQTAAQVTREMQNIARNDIRQQVATTQSRLPQRQPISPNEYGARRIAKDFDDQAYFASQNKGSIQELKTSLQEYRRLLGLWHKEQKEAIKQAERMGEIPPSIAKAQLKALNEQIKQGRLAIEKTYNNSWARIKSNEIANTTKYHQQIASMEAAHQERITALREKADKQGFIRKRNTLKQIQQLETDYIKSVEQAAQKELQIVKQSEQQLLKLTESRYQKELAKLRKKIKDKEKLLQREKELELKHQQQLIAINNATGAKIAEINKRTARAEERAEKGGKGRGINIHQRAG